MKSNTSTKSNVKLYRGFSGINTTTSEVALEAPDRQPFIYGDNLFCSPGGYLSNERPMKRLGEEQAAVTHIRRHSVAAASAVYAARLAGYIELRATDFAVVGPRWPVSSIISSTIFNRKVVLAAQGQAPAVFDGSVWSTLDSAEAKSGPSIAVTVANRLVFSGYASDKTEVIVSRVDQENTLSADEQPGEVSVIKGFRFNVRNHLGSADFITGIAQFGSSRLAIFTNDKALVWVADADYTKWGIDPTAAINVGCISHNTIQAIGDEVFFCSRGGIHSIRRSVLNGATVFTQPITRDIEQTYRMLVASVRDPRAISACFDRDNGRYTVFFPVNEKTTYRLSVDVLPRVEEQTATAGTWSLSTHAGLNCGDSLAGTTMFGSTSGILTLGREFDGEYGGRGAGYIDTPILWHDQFLSIKRSHSLILYASGVGRVEIDASDETGRHLASVYYDLADPDGFTIGGPPLVRQFERPFQHSYSGLRLRLKIADGANQIRVFAFGVRLGEV